MSTWRVTKHEAGATRFELMVLVVILGIGAAIFLDRFRYYQEFAEKTVMEVTVVNMRTGLRYRMAELILKNRTNELAQLAQENPVQWLSAPPPAPWLEGAPQAKNLPPNYLGELTNPKISEIPPGSWYFDLGKRQLVYRVNLGRHFVNDAEFDEKIVRYQVTVEMTKAGAGGASSSVEWVAVKLVEPYHWF